MTSPLNKKDLVALYCYCGQARGSIDRILCAPKRWGDFVDYYDEAKRHALTELISLLKRSGAASDKTNARITISENILFAMFWSLAGPIINKTKTSWSFTREQLSFFCSTLESLLKTLETPEPPDNQELAELRVDFHRCQSIVGRKLLGVPELRDAHRIEHFGRSEFLEYVTLRQMGVDVNEVSI